MAPRHPTTKTSDLSRLVTGKCLNMPVLLTWMDWRESLKISMHQCSCWWSADEVLTGGWGGSASRTGNRFWDVCGHRRLSATQTQKMTTLIGVPPLGCPLLSMSFSSKDDLPTGSEEKLVQMSPFFFRDLAVKWENWDHFIKSYRCLDPICSDPSLPIIISTGCQDANTMSLICFVLHSITPFSPRSDEQTVALAVVSQHL